MSLNKFSALTASWLLAGILSWLPFRDAYAQVSPNEILDPHLKQSEATYFPQMMALYRAINGTKFPFSFRLSRYVGSNQSQQAETDARGLEFVEFKNRTVLKVSGDYNAAYSAELLTANERATRTFSDVIIPILALVVTNVPTDVGCDAVGFEISYHVRTQSRAFDYEGKEILVVVFDRADAFAFQNARDDSERQEILNRSQIFVDGKEFGLALNQKAPFDAEAIGKYALPQAVSPSLASREADSRAGSTLVNPKLLPGSGGPTNRMPSMSSLGAGSVLDSHVMAPAPTMPGVTAQDHPVTATPADAEHLQSQFQVQLDALGSVGKAQFHFVDYASPSFAVFQNKMVLQLTLRNTLHFNADTTSIYKRSAQSFDLFLAPQLKDLVDKVPSDASFDGYDFTVVNQIGADPRPASEAIEFVCPRGALREFVDAGITNQQLIDQSIVLVNGVRIALNLQLVE